MGPTLPIPSGSAYKVQVRSASQKRHYPPHFLTHTSRSRANFFRTYIFRDRLDESFYWHWKVHPTSRSHPPPPTGNLLPTRYQIYPHKYSEAFSLTYLRLWILRRSTCRRRLCYPYTSPPNCLWFPSLELSNRSSCPQYQTTSSCMVFYLCSIHDPRLYLRHTP